MNGTDFSNLMNLLRDIKNQLDRLIALQSPPASGPMPRGSGGTYRCSICGTWTGTGASHSCGGTPSYAGGQGGR
jgi:hypothetical protein